jgi:hypothetical protein
MSPRPSDPTACNPPCAASIGHISQIQGASSQGFSVMLVANSLLALFCILFSFSLHSCVICPSHSLPFFPPDAVPHDSQTWACHPVYLTSTSLQLDLPSSDQTQQATCFPILKNVPLQCCFERPYLSIFFCHSKLVGWPGRHGRIARHTVQHTPS